MSKTKISVIIPILNEEKTIKGLIEHLVENSSSKNIKEIIVVDGGSTDNSRAKATLFKEVVFIESSRGRACQMNAGARVASGEVLYFLHADSFPPKSFDGLILDKISRNYKAGCFMMKFDSRRWELRLAGWFTKFNWKICRGGDQSQFIYKALFEEIGGFDEDFIIYEDNDLINKLYARKQFVIIKKWLITSARRYEINGIWKLQFHFLIIHIKKRLGASPKEIHNYYLKHIS